MRTSLLLSFFFLVVAVNARAQCDPALVVPSDGTAIPTPVVMSEVNPGAGGYIELFNPTNAVVNMTGWWFCSPFNYSPVGAINVPAGGYVTVAWPANFNDTDAGGEVQLYDSSSFGTSTDIIDFVCWGTNPHGSRKGQAESVGKWSGACCGVLVNGAIHRITNTTGTTAASYNVTAAPSPMNCTPSTTSIGGTPSHPAISLAISPNPFSALATITFNISTSASVSADVYSVTGERVRHMDNAEFSQGTGRLLWDGKDDGGRALPSGVYMVRVKANQTEATRRVTILR